MVTANEILIGVCIIGLIILAILLYSRHRIKKKLAKLNPLMNINPAKISEKHIPEEVSKLFNEMEQMKKEHPEKQPFEIMWEITKRHHEYSQLLKGGNENGTGTEVNNRTGASDIQGLGVSQSRPVEVQPLDNRPDKKPKKFFKRVN